MSFIFTDLFSHKIHSSGDEWADKLVELTFLFAEFDNAFFNRDKIEKRLMSISPRASYAARDASKFRDEISAYPAYLGLYRLETSSRGWKLVLSETAKAFLLKEEPDVGSFMRLQMALFQYPNGMGAAYRQGTNEVRIQANARDRTLGIIANGIHLSPLRLICRSLLAEAELKGVSPYKVFLHFDKIFALANSPAVNRKALPDIAALTEGLEQYEKGIIKAPAHYESRFHILKHTELFDIMKGGIKFRTPVDKADERDLYHIIGVLNNLEKQFNGFDSSKNGNDIEELIASGEWGRYFDALATLSGDEINALSSDIIAKPSVSMKIKEAPEPVPLPLHIPPETMPMAYDFRKRGSKLPAPSPFNRKTELADPEVTRIKRQRRNLHHKLLVDRMHTHLVSLGAKPMENAHIDLYAKIPNDGSFIFEIKSGGDNLLDQLRKGISQLYEYRFRYKDKIEDDPTLCLVVPDAPEEMPWLYEYLCKDREICLCWFEDEKLATQELCASKMDVLLRT